MIKINCLYLIFSIFINNEYIAEVIHSTITLQENTAKIKYIYSTVSIHIEMIQRSQRTRKNTINSVKTHTLITPSK